MLVLVATLFAAPNEVTDSLFPVVMKRSVLVVSGTSTLEAAVVSKLNDLLAADNISLARIDIANVQLFHPDSFGIVILMSAVDKTELRPEVQNYINSFGNANKQTTVIIAKVNGETWQAKETVIDAITQASTTLQPGRIAKKLYKRILAGLSPATDQR